jgi:serine phosphatase RsbU (regulator of sigma subunit)/ketosteroid isomerase-like protein
MLPTRWRKARVGKEEEALVSVEENNKALVRRFFEAQDRGDLSVVDELLAPDFVDHSLLPGQEPDREGYLRAVAEYYAAVSDSRTSFHYQTTDGDMVISRVTTRNVHDQGALMGLAPKGEEHETTGILIHRISGGKIAEEWCESSGLAATLEERLEEEARERERIEQELRVARRIQQASLPKEVPQLEGWQINPFYQPAREVGGDFYDFFELEYGQLGLVVGDATGKGVPAALVMASARSMLRAVAQALGSSSPGEVLARVNEALVTDIPSNMFVTCFYAILEPENGSLRYANAGHDLPYLWHGGDCEELRARGMPLGLMPSMGYEEGEASLREDHGVLFYSDGLVEAHNPEGEMFGFPRLRALVAKHGEDRSLGNILLEELYSFVGEGWEQEDDITLLTLKCSPTRS